MKEQEKYEEIKKLVDHGGSKKRASIRLNMSIRQINRLIKIYKEEGKSGFVHGNRGKQPVQTLDKPTSDKIIQLYRTMYQGFNFKHFHWYLDNVEDIHISYTCLYKLLTKERILSPKAHRLTKKNLKKQIKELKNKDLSNEEIEEIINHEMALEDSHPRQEKPKYFGEIIEMDGSIHNWFGNNKTCLHLAIDKAKNVVVGGYFDNQETLNGYYNTLLLILINYGIPYSFVTDNRTVFNYNSLNANKRTADKDVSTQFGYACSQLGIVIKTTSVSQAKGLIERTNQTFQCRLVNELKLNNITTIEEANKYLIEVFIPKHNALFAKNYLKSESVFEQAPSIHDIYNILAIITPRKIDNGNAVKYHNKYYLTYSEGNLICLKPKTNCLVIKTFDNRLLLTADDKVYELFELKTNKEYSENFDEITKQEPKTKGHVPPMSHPWKHATFMNTYKKAHTDTDQMYA